MNKINNKAFTMVELLAAISIIIVLSGIVIISVYGYLMRTHSDYCTSITDMMEIAGRDYYSDYRTLLPLEGENRVSLKTLIDEKYIDPLTDYNNDSCDGNRSYVSVYKHFGNTYYYVPHLVCGKCQFSSSKSGEESVPEISFSPNSGKYMDKDVTVEMKITDSKNDLISYRYELLKQVGDEFVRIDEVEKGNLSSNEVKKNIKLNTKGTYKIRAQAYNKIYKKVEKESGEYILDFNLDCEKNIQINVLSDGKTENNLTFKEDVWTSGKIQAEIEPMGAVDHYNVYVSMSGKDGVYDRRNLTFWTNKKEISFDKNSSGTYYIKVEAFDDQGSSCEVIKGPYKQDNKAPSCNIDNPYENKWVNRALDLKASCTDSESGCNQSITSLHIADNGEYSYPLSVYDKVGNKGSCSTSVKIDTKKPVCEVYLSGIKGNNNYYTSSVTATLNKADYESGVKNYGLSASNQSSTNQKDIQIQENNTGNGKTKIYYGYVEDQAGNVSRCQSTGFKVDKDPPSCELALKGTVGANGWFIDPNTKVKINISKLSDKGSGVSSCEFNNKKLSGSDCVKNGSIATLNKDAKNKSFKLKIYDAAGNSNTCSVKVNRDATGPVIHDYSIQTTAGHVCNNGATNKIVLPSGQTATLKVKFTIDVEDKMSGIGSIRYIIAPIALLDNFSPTIYTPTSGNYDVIEATNYIKNGEGKGETRLKGKTGTVSINIGPFNKNVSYCFDYTAMLQVLDKAGNWGYSNPKSPR